MSRAKNWFAEVAVVGSPTLLQAQAKFITQFVGSLFDDMDAGRLVGAKSANFHRLGSEVRFRVIGEPARFAALVADVEARLAVAQVAGLLTGFRSEPESNWETPDLHYGTGVLGVASPFTQFMEAVSRATIALLRSSGTTAVPEMVLWNWLHLVHNPMTGLTRDLVEVAPGASVHQL